MRKKRLLCNNKTHCQFIGFSFQVIINVLRDIYTWGQILRRFQFWHKVWLKAFSISLTNLIRDPGLPCFVIQCQGIDFPLGEITNQKRVETASWVNKPVFSCSTFPKINYLPYLFSLSTLLWILASLSLLIFSLSWCLGTGDKSPAL